MHLLSQWPSEARRHRRRRRGESILGQTLGSHVPPIADLPARTRHLPADGELTDEHLDMRAARRLARAAAAEERAAA